MDNNDEFDDKNKLDNDSFAGNYNRRQLIKELTIYGIILIICVFVIPKFVVQRTIVKGESMESTLESKDNLFVEKLSYRFTDPDRFDIVCFYPYGRSVKTEYYVKRVIGLPGETVQIINNTFYINGNPLEESFGKDKYISYYGIASEPVTLGKEYITRGSFNETGKDVCKAYCSRISNLCGYSFGMYIYSSTIRYSKNLG